MTMAGGGGGGGGGERDMKSEEVAPFTSSWTRVARPKLFLGREQCCCRNVRHNPSTAAAAVAVASAVRPPSSLQMVTHFSASQSIPFAAASNKKRTTPSRT